MIGKTKLVLKSAIELLLGVGPHFADLPPAPKLALVVLFGALVLCIKTHIVAPGKGKLRLSSLAN